MTAPRPWHVVLGVARDASKEEIVAAFRTAAKRCHPDLGGSAADMDALLVARDQGLARLEQRDAPRRPFDDPDHERLHEAAMALSAEAARELARKHAKGIRAWVFGVLRREPTRKDVHVAGSALRDRVRSEASAASNRGRRRDDSNP